MTKCFFSDEHCTDGLTKEHVISHSVLSELGPMDFTFNGQSFKIWKKSAVLPYLCGHHNHALSIYDSEALKFVSSWKKITSKLPDRSDFVKYDVTGDATEHGQPILWEAVSIDTRKFERWLLKTFIGLILHRTYVDNNFAPFFAPNVDRLRNILFHGAPIERPFGLYQIPPDQMLIKKNAWSFTPQYRDGWHISDKTQIATKCSMPTIMLMKFGPSELVGLYNLSPFPDEQALEVHLDGWKQKLEAIGIYRSEINCYGKKIWCPQRKSNVLRGVKFFN